MREIIEEANSWRADDEDIALATVISTWGSAPRKTGAKMAVTAEGRRMAGSVSGGCVEGAVVEAGTETLSSGRPQLLHFGVADETAWSVGLACGGKIDVFVERLQPDVQETVSRWLAEERGGAVVTVLSGPAALLGKKLLVAADGSHSGSIEAAHDAVIAREAQRVLQGRHSKRVALPDTELDLFVDVVLPPPALVMVGGVHISVALAKLANTLEYRTVVVDPRRAFGSEERFAHADRLIQAWPQKAFETLAINGATAIAVLTHDPKIDDPALEQVLDSPAFYIGALGSRGTAAKRRARLLEKGYTEVQLDRIRGPIGLDIDAQTPEEIALAIMAEVVAAYRSGVNA